MRLFFLFLLLPGPVFCGAQTSKNDTIQGVVVYTGYSDMRYIAKGNFHTYTAAATMIKADTGVVSIRTEFGYIDLKKNYRFYRKDELQEARLKKKP